MMIKKIRLSLAVAGISLSMLLPNVSFAELGVSYDQMTYQELPQTVLNPFSYQGLVSVRENNFSDHYSSLPKNIPDYWDVVSVGRDILEKECGMSGRLDPIDYENLPHKDLLMQGALHKCGVGFAVQAMTLNYAFIHKYGVPPTYWTDLFDFNRFPGKRALPKQSRYLFEIILLADGVQPAYVYPLLSTKEGQDRALNKLDLIFDEIIWWTDLNSVRDWLDKGFITMSVAPDGAMLTKGGIDTIGVSRHQVLYEMRYYALLKESKQKDLAYAFISYATQPDQQLKLANTQYYGPVIKQAWRLVSPEVADYLTNKPENIQGGLLLNYDFYVKYGDELEKRFNDWYANKQAPVRVVNTFTGQIEEEAAQPIEVEVIEIEFVGPEPLEFIGPELPEFIGPILLKQN